MNELYELTERHVAGESTPEEAARLHTLLLDKNARAMFVRHVTLMATVRGLCSATDHEVAELRSMTGADPVRRPARWLPRVLALAASVVIVAGGVWWMMPAAPLGVRVAQVGGKCSVFSVSAGGGSAFGGQYSEGRGVPALRGMGLRRGDRVVVPEGGKAELKYEGEETAVALHSGSAVFSSEKGAKRLKLESGLLVGAVAPQKSPFLLETPHGVAEVVGTHFSLSANGAQTTLAVQDGQVALRQHDQKLDVNGGETAVADASGLRKLSPADAWLRELLVRAETGPWDVVNIGTGVYSQDVWRMDARGGPAERRIWNMRQESDRSSIASFRDGKRWARGVVTGRMMILPEGQAALDVGGAATAPAMGWIVHRFRVENADGVWRKSRITAVTLSGGRPPERERNNICPILNADEDPAGVWHRFAVYFDMETPEVQRLVYAAWPEGAAMPRPASEWVLQRFASKGDSEVEFGLMAKGVLMVAQGLKFVPLGPDMPMPPKELLDRK